MNRALKDAARALLSRTADLGAPYEPSKVAGGARAVVTSGLLTAIVTADQSGVRVTVMTGQAVSVPLLKLASLDEARDVITGTLQARVVAAAPRAAAEASVWTPWAPQLRGVRKSCKLFTGKRPPQTREVLFVHTRTRARGRYTQTLNWDEYLALGELVSRSELMEVQADGREVRRVQWRGQDFVAIYDVLLAGVVTILRPHEYTQLRTGAFRKPDEAHPAGVPNTMTLAWSALDAWAA